MQDRSFWGVVASSYSPKELEEFYDDGEEAHRIIGDAAGGVPPSSRVPAEDTDEHALEL